MSSKSINMWNKHLIKINKHVIYTSQVKYSTLTNISMEYHYYPGLLLEPEAPIPMLLEIEGLSIPMSGGGCGSVDDCTSDTHGGGGGGSVDEEYIDTCEGEGWGGGGGRSMDGVVANTSGLGGLGRKRSMGRSSNVLALVFSLRLL